MTMQQIESSLKGMVGKLYMHNTDNKRVLRFKIDHDYVRIVTDVDDINIKPADFKLRLQDFLPVDETPIKQANSLIIQKTVVGSSAFELKEILMDNIKKVQGNKDYIPQAVEINNNVKSIIDLAKAEVEMYKSIRN